MLEHPIDKSQSSPTTPERGDVLSSVLSTVLSLPRGGGGGSGWILDLRLLILLLLSVHRLWLPHRTTSQHLYIYDDDAKREEERRREESNEKRT